MERKSLRQAGTQPLAFGLWNNHKFQYYSNDFLVAKISHPIPMTYFIRIRGKAFGPLNEEQLKDMKAKGSLGKTTEVSENKTDWRLAETLEFLFPLPPPPPQPPLSFSSSTSSATYGVQSPSQPVQESADWYYSIDGTEGYGPMTAASIEQMFRSGQLDGDSYVWQHGQNARFIKDEPRFSRTGNGSAGGNTGDMAKKVGDMAKNVGGKVLSHVAASFDSPSTSTQPFSRHTFIFLAVFVGIFGIHDFYVKRNAQGAIHIACLAPWIFVAFYAVVAALLMCCGFTPPLPDPIYWTPKSPTEAARLFVVPVFCLYVLPFISYVIALFDIVCVTTDGFDRELERF
jgi:hypothetical protein